MRAIIGPNLLSSKAAQPTKKPFEIYDSRLPGFTLRVQPSGICSYYARFGRNRRIALGQAGTIEPDEARERCQKVLGNVAHGRHPLHGLGGILGCAYKRSRKHLDFPIKIGRGSTFCAYHAH